MLVGLYPSGHFKMKPSTKAASPTVNQAQKHENGLILSYTALQRLLGYIGLALPMGLILYAVISGAGLQPSISDFYYTPMGDVLVGTLCAIGVFLLCYRGYAPLTEQHISDRQVSFVAGLAAIGVAIFPVVRAGYPPVCTVNPCLLFGSTWHPDVFHYASAGVFFACLAIFCLILFPRGDQDTSGRIIWTTPRNKFYAVCGGLIVIAMGAMIPYVLGSPQTRDHLGQYNYLFWWETLGILAFAASWLRKGKAHDAVAKVIKTMTNAA